MSQQGASAAACCNGARRYTAAVADVPDSEARYLNAALDLAAVAREFLEWMELVGEQLAPERSSRLARETRDRFGERLPAPLVTILKPGGLASLGMTLDELHGYGFRLLIDPSTPALAAYEAMKKVYAELAEPGFAVRSRPQEDWTRLQKEQQVSVDIDKMIEIERRTTEKPSV